MSAKLEKDETINQVLVKMFERFGRPNFDLTDFWDGDLCAIGIKSPKDDRNLIYISTYKIKEYCYFVEVEDSNREVILNGYKDGELYERNFEELSGIVEKYLHLKPIYEQ